MPSIANLNLQDILIRVLVVTLSLSLHEYAHARVAYALGDDTAALQGRLTLNPLAHLDPIGTLCFIVARIGWAKPVPINPLRFSRARSMKQGIVLVSLAGPVANLLLSWMAAFLHSVLTLALRGFNVPSTALSIQAFSLLSLILQSFFISNIFLAVFNLMPFPPLDGYKIFGALLPSRLYYRIMSYERYIGMAFLFLFLFGGSFLSRVMMFLAQPFVFIITKPLELLLSLFTS